MKNDKIENEICVESYPLVTVLIPTYNRPYFLSMAIESVLAQTYPNIEIFISDNSPNEDTKNMILLLIGIEYRNIVILKQSILIILWMMIYLCRLKSKKW